MGQQMINAAPMLYSWGIEDLSSEQIPVPKDEVGQHVPLSFVWAAKGDNNFHLVEGQQAQVYYGDQTFDPSSIYFNHSTLFATRAYAKANKVMQKRIIPADAKSAVLVVYCTVEKTNVPLYERDLSGGYKLDAGGLKIPAGTKAGVKITWTTEAPNKTWDEILALKPVTTGAKTKYPMQAYLADEGVSGNNLGIQLWANVGGALNTSVLAKQKALTFSYAIVEKATAATSPSFVKTINTAPAVEVALSKNVTNNITGEAIDLTTILKSQYENTQDTRYPLVYSPFKSFKVWDENFALATADAYKVEKADIPVWSTLKNRTDDFSKELNILTAIDAAGYPYDKIVMDTGAGSVVMKKGSVLYLQNGTDGTMDEASFNAAVVKEMEAYADVDSEVMDIVYNVESRLYDSGFDVDTKKQLCKFISIKDNTFVFLSTHVHGTETITRDEEHSIAEVLSTALEMYPESEYFGTAVTRAMIVKHSCLLRNHPYKERVPALIEVLDELAEVTGASNGKWKSKEHVDGSPEHPIVSTYAFSNPFSPQSLRFKAWDVGYNIVQRFNRTVYMFGALKTIYKKDSSVLTGMYPVLAICYTQVIADRVWREFSGVTSMTNAQLVERVNAAVTRETKGIFDGKVTVEPQATVTELDAKRGTSWTLPILVKGPNMKTAQRVWIKVKRLDQV